MEEDRVEIVPYRKEWAEQFSREKNDLARALAPRRCQIEHIGSTSVPGMIAKPTIDIALKIENVGLVGELTAPLARLSYRYMGEYGLPGRHFFVKGESRTFHLHVVDGNTDHWERWLRFREILRNSEDVREKYLALKRDLVEKYHSERPKYTAGKSDLINAVLSEDQTSFSGGVSPDAHGTGGRTMLLETEVKPDWQGLLACIERRGAPRRVHYIELFLDGEVQEAICRQFSLLTGLDPDDPHFPEKRTVRIQRFLGYDYVRQGVSGLDMPLNRFVAEDTAGLRRESGRSFIDEKRGPITNWEEFEKYPWPDPEKAATRELEWYEKNLPDDMCIIGSGGFGHFAELLNWLMGYETLCYALYDSRDLVKAIADRLEEIYTTVLGRILEFKRVKVVWGSDDMGFKTGTLISPDDLREFVLPGHSKMARMAHAAGRPYLLHSCGNLSVIMDDLINDVKIDALHSFEDTILRVEDAKKKYGDRIALLGGIDVDFLCRAGEEEIRARVRATLDACMPGGGYCLGSGNSVANYIPVENYLIMLDEGRRRG